MTQPAKVLASRHVRNLCKRAGRGRYALRNRLIVLLSYKAGLRACEIAGLDWSMVLTAKAHVAASLTIAGTIAKNGRGRRIQSTLNCVTHCMLITKLAASPLQGPWCVRNVERI